MSAILLLFCAGSIYKMRLGDNDNYVSRKQTLAINGIFTFLIFMSHFITYIDADASIHQMYLLIRKFLGQLVVVTFLFFSGYGMFESFKRKKEDYIQTIPTRFVKLLLKFDIAVLLYFGLSILLHKNYPIKRVFLALIGWESIGNSNWYIFVLLSLYIIIYLSFKAIKDKPLLSLIAMTLGSMVFIAMMKYVGKTSNWYNTVLCFPAGMWFSYYKEEIEKIWKKYPMSYYILFVICIFGFLICHRYRNYRLSYYELMSILFCICIVLTSIKITLNSPILQFLGNHIFSIYILQRLAMIVGKHIGLGQNYLLYFVFTFTVTLVLAIIFDIVTKRIDALNI